VNTLTIIFLIIAIALEHISGLLIMRQNKGSPLTRAMTILAQPFFMLAVGFSSYLAGITVWLRVPIALVLGYILWVIWIQLPLSTVFNRIEYRLIWGQLPSVRH
jgi:hypothetical protein